MIINISQSKLFTIDPAKRFAREYKVSEDIWHQIWKRYRLLEYSDKELCEIYYILVGHPINKRQMNRWIFRTEIYTKTKPMIDKGIKAVDSSFFGSIEQRVIKEVLRHLKSGDTKNSKMLV